MAYPMMFLIVQGTTNLIVSPVATNLPPKLALLHDFVQILFLILPFIQANSLRGFALILYKWTSMVFLYDKTLGDC